MLESPGEQAELELLSAAAALQELGDTEGAPHRRVYLVWGSSSSGEIGRRKRWPTSAKRPRWTPSDR